MPETLPYLVEPMTLTDVDEVMAIERIVFPAPWPARAYRYEIVENQHSTMLVVRPLEGGRGLVSRLRHQLGVANRGPVLAYGGFWLLVDEAHICTIAVDPRLQGRGLGEFLLLSLLECGVGLGASRATLEVRVSNQVAQELYRKVGFEVVSRQKRYYTNNNEDAYIMATPPFESAAYQILLGSRRSQLYTRLKREHGELVTMMGPLAVRAQKPRTG